jgi:gamma-glutamylcyclotransferase (GGCT)/AIG2-like uncharacterized protein YtfP
MSPVLPFFVYGTLKHGESNYGPFLAGRTLSEQPATLAGAALYSAGAYPYLVVEPDLVTSDDYVHGMVMTVQPALYDEVLQQIDRLEDYIPGDPYNEYERITRVAQTPSGAVEVWAYVAGARVLDMIREGHLSRISGGIWQET